MGTLMKNRQVVGGTPVVDTALDTQSTDVVQNKVVAEAISTTNSKLSFSNRKSKTTNFSVGANTYVTLTMSVTDAELGIISGFQVRSAPKTCPVYMYFSDINTISIRLYNADGGQNDGSIVVYYL